MYPLSPDIQSFGGKLDGSHRWKSSHEALSKRGVSVSLARKDDALYIVNRGKVRIYRLSNSGKEQLVRILNPGDFTGEWTLFNPDAVHEEYAEATRDTSVCMIQQHDVQEFLKSIMQFR